MQNINFFVGIIIVIVIVIFYFFIWPGIYRINAYKLEGYWIDSNYNINNIIAINRRKFKVINGNGEVYGNTFAISGVHIDGIPNGWVLNDNRSIQWSNNIWTKQAY